MLLCHVLDINIENLHAKKVVDRNSHAVLDLFGIPVLHARGCFFLFRGQNSTA